MEFVKMHGLGNDFIIMDNRKGQIADAGALAAKLCARRLNIGADGLVLVEDSEVADTRMRIINADGSEAEMCGNGIRCFARFVYDAGIVTKETFTVETLAGIMIPAMILTEDVVTGIRVDMGSPDFSAENVPMDTDGSTLLKEIDVCGSPLKVSSVLMGVPHTVVFVEENNASWADFDRLGPLVEKHNIYPKNTNVNFAEIVGESRAKVRTWERGAGPTLACGTGSCAVACIMKALGLGGDRIVIELQAGELIIERDGETVYMTGPAEYVMQGTTEVTL